MRRLIEEFRATAVSAGRWGFREWRTGIEAGGSTPGARAVVEVAREAAVYRTTAAWAIDFAGNVAASGCPLRIFSLVDSHTRVSTGLDFECWADKLREQGFVRSGLQPPTRIYWIFLP